MEPSQIMRYFCLTEFQSMERFLSKMQLESCQGFSQEQARQKAKKTCRVCKVGKGGVGRLSARGTIPNAACGREETLSRVQFVPLGVERA